MAAKHDVGCEEETEADENDDREGRQRFTCLGHGSPNLRGSEVRRGRHGVVHENLQRTQDGLRGHYPEADDRGGHGSLGNRVDRCGSAWIARTRRAR